MNAFKVTHIKATITDSILPQGDVVVPLTLCERAHKAYLAKVENDKEIAQIAAKKVRVAQLKEYKAKERFLIKLLGIQDASEVIKSFNDKEEAYTICGYLFNVIRVHKPVVPVVQMFNINATGINHYPISGHFVPEIAPGLYLLPHYCHNFSRNYINTLAGLGSWLVAIEEFKKTNAQIHRENTKIKIDESPVRKKLPWYRILGRLFKAPFAYHKTS